MSNLYKYIQTINEADSKGNEGEIYEKLITLALNFLILQKKGESIQTTIKTLKDDPTEIAELEEFSRELDKIIAKENLTREDFDDANEIFKEINGLIKLKKIEDKKIIFTNVKNRKTLIRRKSLLNLLLKKEDIYLQKLKETFGKEEYKEFIDIQNEDIVGSSEKKKTIHRVAYEIAKNIDLYFINKQEIIIRVSNIGSRSGQISNEWKNLFSNKTQSSKIKTDVILETNNRIYNLSLKMNDNRFGTPKYIDIYTLILHAINRLLEENKAVFISKLNSDNKIIEQETEDIFLKEKDKKISQIRKNLVEILGIDEQQTDGYITIINISLMIDLLFTKEKITEKNTIQDIQNILVQITKDNSIVKNIFEKFKSLTITEEDIEEIIKENPDNIIERVDNLIKIKIENMNKSLREIDFSVKLPMSLLPSNDDNAKQTDEETAKRVVIQKLVRQNIEELIRLFIGVSDGKYFGNIGTISNNIEKLNIFFNDSNKEEKYKNALNLRSVAKKASLNLNLLFNNNNEILQKIFDDVDFEIVKNFFNNSKNKEFIKKEIIMEALTGKAKFGKREKYIATHVLTYDKASFKIDVKQIDDAYVDSISSQVKIKFGFKGSADKSFNTMQITPESFFGDIKNKIDSVVDNVKVKTLKIISSVKKKSLRLLKLFGIEIKIKKATMPQWIIDKL